MSGLGVLFNRDGAPSDPRAMRAMIDAIVHRGAASGVWDGGAVAIGSIGSCASAGDGDLHITFDGRIDNRPELTSRLGRVDDGETGASDAALALAAYRAWNVGAFEKILGDFVVVVWDARERRLVCARDVVGVKPFYYYADGQRFVGGSELQQLFAAAPIRAEPNEGFVGEYLCGRFNSRDETLYRDVFRLPPAHVLVVDSDQVTAKPYYDPYPTSDIRYHSDADYAEHFRSVLSEAVRCRLPVGEPVAAYLSGGLDSSSVVCLAAHLREQRSNTDGPLVTLSMTASTKEGDERSYVDAVVRRWPVRAHRVEAGPPDPRLFVDQASRWRDMPEYPNIAATTALACAARDEGCRAVLSGYGGDDWLTAPYYHCAELLSRGRLREFMTQLSSERDADPRQSTWTTFLRRGVWPLLPERLRRSISRARGRSGIPSHVARRLAAAVSLDDRMQPRRIGSRRCPSRTQQELYEYFWSGDVPHAFEVEDRHHAQFGLEIRHPLHDRRVVEFLLAIPEEQRWRGERTKFVLRNAMESLLPDEVRLRLTKGDYSHAFMAALEACGGSRCFHRLETAERGWVQPEAVAAAYQQAREQYLGGDWRYSFSMYKLWTVYGLELWLGHAVN